MAQNQGLLVDVDIEPVRGGDDGSDSAAPPLTLSGGGGPREGISNNAAKNTVFDAIDTIQTYQNSVEVEASEAVGRYRERNNSVDSTNSIRSYDSTGKPPASPPVLSSSRSHSMARVRCRSSSKLKTELGDCCNV